VLHNDYPDQVCSIARGLEVVGERWTLLIVRDVLLGSRRFEEFIENLGVTRTVLSDRLSKLVEHGVLERHRYQQRPERYEYLPTAKAYGLYPVIATLMRWGDEHYPHPAGPPRRMLHHDCGGELEFYQHCRRCAATPGPDEVDSQLNPALRSSASSGNVE
jgi:DNA-binding HxlR family transcriptional regulator